jgi:hypothetical protein
VNSAPLHALLLALWGAAVAGVGSGAAQPPSAPPPVPAPLEQVLEASEISVIESGGVAGRVHAVRLAAVRGRVAVEYRPREASVSAPPFAGTLEPDRYVLLWRDLESAGVWDASSPRPARGADLIRTEIRVRIGESGRVVAWDEAPSFPLSIRELAEVAQRVFAAGRSVAYTR